MQEIWALVLVVALFSAVQSLFGVGLLVFGTPTLLVLGYSFESTIGILLPSSIAISAMQVVAGWGYVGQLKKSVFTHSVPLIAVGLMLVLSRAVAIDMTLLVGLMLVATAAIRYAEGIQRYLSGIAKRHLKGSLMAIGMVHGLSNMGGGLLTLLVTTLYDDKESIRANIAYGYLVFAVSQLIVLILVSPAQVTVYSLLLPLIALATYRTIGTLIYLKASSAGYQRMITLFILTYGVLLICQELI